jgi:hypothetical protein
MTEKGFNIPKKLWWFNTMHGVISILEYLLNVSPIVSSGLSLYFGYKDQLISGGASMGFTILIIPVKDFFKGLKIKVEDWHRDSLLQTLDIESIKSGTTRKGFVMQLLGGKHEQTATGSSSLLSHTETMTDGSGSLLSHTETTDSSGSHTEIESTNDGA